LPITLLTSDHILAVLLLLFLAVVVLLVLISAGIQDRFVCNCIPVVSGFILTVLAHHPDVLHISAIRLLIHVL
ncbi:MAG: hypothetical protein ACK55Z_06590, partial [bacterium]